MTARGWRGGVPAAVRQWARRHFGSDCAALLYGSYAAGTDGPDSDLDCFVVLLDHRRHDLPAAKEDYLRLQRRLGFNPDPVHPVEVFALHECRDLLQTHELRTRLEASCRAGCPLAGDDDAREVFHALTSPRLVLLGKAVIDLLEAEARELSRSVAFAAGCHGQRPCALHQRQATDEG